MENELLLRVLGALISGGLSVWIILDGGFWLYVEMALCLGGLLREWIKINRSKNGPLFIGGCIYLTLPMLFWSWKAFYFPDMIAKEILWVLTIVATCDTFAFFGGRILGGPKLAPKISPNKTWSGVVVGAIFAYIASIVYVNTIFVDTTQWRTKWTVILIVAAILGDLLESKVKRVLKVKDTGNAIPGHGGLCDRLDSFLMATYVRALMLGCT
ncbi:MAG: phosphatidate cytidylyltransferase [Holosporales bacterium]|jgi:phosphatidate cytidylyltransferase|nr:phosphatidate cytidylyltransferase [Holosporales bacterium]